MYRIAYSEGELTLVTGPSRFGARLSASIRAGRSRLLLHPVCYALPAALLTAMLLYVSADEGVGDYDAFGWIAVAACAAFGFAAAALQIVSAAFDTSREKLLPASLILCRDRITVVSPGGEAFDADWDWFRQVRKTRDSIEFVIWESPKLGLTVSRASISPAGWTTLNDWLERRARVKPAG